MVAVHFTPHPSPPPNRSIIPHRCGKPPNDDKSPNGAPSLEVRPKGIPRKDSGLVADIPHIFVALSNSQTQPGPPTRGSKLLLYCDCQWSFSSTSFLKVVTKANQRGRSSRNFADWHCVGRPFEGKADVLACRRIGTLTTNTNSEHDFEIGIVIIVAVVAVYPHFQRSAWFSPKRAQGLALPFVSWLWPFPLAQHRHRHHFGRPPTISMPESDADS